MKDLLDKKSADTLVVSMGPEFLRGWLAGKHPEVYSEMFRVREELETIGFSFIENKMFASDSEEAKLLIAAASSFLGAPSRVQKNNDTFIWPVTYSPADHEIKTFSETQGEAAFHTDTSYGIPEKYFGLFCVISDTEGKGTNTLVDMRRVEAELSDSAVRNLKDEFPFRVPTLFTREQSDSSPEVIWAAIIEESGHKYRYRKDLIEEAIALGHSISQSQEEALKELESKLVSDKKIHLLPGQALFVDNHRFLHARTAFDDETRLLYRVRIHKEK